MENPINKFEIEFEDNHLMNKIQTSWMGTDFTKPIDVKEDFEIFIDGEKIVIDLVEDYEPFSVLILNKNCEFKRILREHEIFPNPEIILNVENKDNVKHNIKFVWKMESENNYALIKEHLSEKYTNYSQAYLFFLKIPTFLQKKSHRESNFVIETDLEPGQSDKLQITMFFSRNFIDSLGFSGIGFLIDQNDKNEAMAAISTNIFGTIETNNHSFPVQSLYSPIYWTDNGKIPNFQTFLEIISQTPIKKLLHTRDIKGEFKEKLQDIGIEFVKIENEMGNEFMDFQIAIDKLFSRKNNNEIVCIVPNNPTLNLNFAAYTGRLRYRLLIYDKKILNILKKIEGIKEILIFGTDEEIPPKLDKKLEKVRKDSIVTRLDFPAEERIIIYQLPFLSQFVIQKLILREYIDPDDSEWELFLKRLNMTKEDVFNRYIHGNEFLHYDQLVLSEVPVNGPQNHILATVNLKEANGWQNAITGANYSKGKNSCCFIIPDYSKSDKRELAYLLKEIDENLEDYWQLVQLSIRIGQILDQNIPLMATTISQYITLFAADASIPFELVFRQGRFGIESIGAKYCMGRIMGDDIYDTTFLATSSLLFSLTPHEISENVLLIGNPTGDLEFSQAETTFLKALLDFYGIGSRFYAGMPVSDELQKRIEDRTKRFGKKLETNFQPIDKPTKSNFLKEIQNATFVHYSGHGGIDNRGPFLVLSDDEFLLEDIPRKLPLNPFIFANACLAGLSVNYEENISLASKFIESGGIGYCGALWRVADLSSLMFGTLLYDFLLFSPIGGVIQQLKNSLSQMYPGDYTFLAFILYGDPTVHFIDPYFKGIEAIYYFENLLNMINTAQEKKAKQYNERTIRAFKIYKNEIEERIKIRPEYEKYYSIMVSNLESRLLYLGGQYEGLKTLDKYSRAFSIGDLGIFGEMGANNIKVADNYMMKAAEAAFDSGLSFQYLQTAYHQKIFGNLLLAITEYSKNIWDKALNYLDTGNSLIQEARDKFNEYIKSDTAGYAPYAIIEKQINIVEHLLNGWTNYIKGIREFNQNKDIAIINACFNLALDNFSAITTMGDTLMADTANSFIRNLLHDYAVCYFDLNNLDGSERVFTLLKSVCERQLTIIDSRLDQIQRELPEEFERIETVQQYVLSLQYISEAFIHRINNTRNPNEDDKRYAIEMVNQAIDMTPNHVLKEKWKIVLKDIS